MAISPWRFIKGLIVKEESDGTKQLEITVNSSATTATKTTIEASQSADRTLTLPDATDTLVGKDTTDILTNKSVGDSGDNTKQVDFNISGANTGTTTSLQFNQTGNRGIVFPDASTTLMGTDTSDTVTNKSIDADNNTITNIDNDEIKASAGIEATKIADGSVDNTEFQRLNGLTGDIQTQLDAKYDEAGAGTDNAVMKINAAGDALERTAVLIDDSNNITGVNDLTVTGNLQVDGTTTTLNTATLDVEDTNITVNKNGNDASSEGAGLTVERTSTDGSIVYEDALASKFKLGALGSEVEVADVSSSQTMTNKDLSNSNNNIDTASSDSFTRNTGNQQVITIPDSTGADNFVLEDFQQQLTNKDIDGGTASDNNRITIPQDTKTNLDGLTRKEGTLVYANDLDTFFGDDGTQLFEIGSGGQGGINYIDNPDMEINIDGYNTYDDGAVAVPVDGTGGSASVLSISRNTTASEVVRGDASLEISKTAADGQGEGVSIDFTIDNADRGKDLTIQFEYYNTANYSSSNLKAYVYDVTNASMQEVRNDDDGDVLFNSTNSKTFLGKFDAADDSTSYRLILHNVNTDASSWSMYVDNVRVGPDTVLQTAIVSGWQAFTPTGSWTTNTTYTGQYRRVGDVLEMNVLVNLSGAPNAATQLAIDIPFGLTIDLTKIAAGASTGRSQADVQGMIHDATGSAWTSLGSIQNSTSVFLRYNLNTGSGSNNNTITSVAPFTFASSDHITVNIKVPIEGWSNGALISTTENSTKNVLARYTTTTAQSIPSASTTIVNYNIQDYDDLSTVTTGGSWAFTAPSAGKYQVNAGMKLSATTSSGWIAQIQIRVNGSPVAFTEHPKESASNISNTGNISDIIDLEKGDTVDIRIFQNSGVGLTLDTTGGVHFVSIAKIQEVTQFGVFGEFQVESFESSVKTPTTSGVYQQYTGNSFTLPAGTWMLQGSVDAGFSGSPSWTRVFTKWHAANGADTGSEPAQLSTITGLSILGGIEFHDANSLSSTDTWRAGVPTLIVSLTEESEIFLNTFTALGTPANGRIKVHGIATRLK